MAWGSIRVTSDSGYRSHLIANTFLHALLSTVTGLSWVSHPRYNHYTPFWASPVLTCVSMAAKPCTKQGCLCVCNLPPSLPASHCFPAAAYKILLLSAFAGGPVDADSSCTLSTIQSKEHVLVSSPQLRSPTGPCSLIPTFHSGFGSTGLAERAPSTVPVPAPVHAGKDNQQRKAVSPPPWEFSPPAPRDTWLHENQILYVKS